MNKENHTMRIRIPLSFLKLTIIGMVTSIISGISIADQHLTTMQYITHYATMFIGCICFVKAIGSIHAYEIDEESKIYKESENEKEINNS